MRTHTAHTKSNWERRLYLPAYQLSAAAAYAGVTTQTVRNWQDTANGGAALAHREAGASLSFLQLQELAIVSVMRKLKVKLPVIRTAREYLANLLKTEFPFSDERVKTDRQDVLLKLASGDLPGLPRKALMVANKGGQYAWPEIVGERFDEFEYEKGIALKWHLSKGVVIDPRISFGAPTVKGVPTWALSGRMKAGESVQDIAEDFGLTEKDVNAALAFERSLH